MDVFANVISIMVAVLISDNIILGSSPLGVCPFLGVSKKTSGAVGMGIAVTFVITASSLICYCLSAYLLRPFGLAYLEIILFILIIASLVQVVEIVLKRFSPTVYSAMGIYLPLITTNCAVLGTAQAVVELEFMLAVPILEVALRAVCVGVGFMLALVLMAGVREKLERSPIAKPLQGFPIALITAGIIALAFMGIGGLSFFG